ncbi:group 3 secretory phospholipase A2 [Ambystoma mexicanum]|uniref:group 3 secretory phospholipase A2 n=1 Tax=Ambystoma mexicanum TaxID=8296 RepID=UPI0037E8CF80
MHTSPRVHCHGKDIVLHSHCAVLFSQGISAFRCSVVVSRHCGAVSGMSPWVSVRFLLSFSAFFMVFALEGSSSLLGSSVTSCHMVKSKAGKVYVSFLSTGMDRVTLYQTIWTKPGRHLLECSTQEEETLVWVYQSFCEASSGNSTDHPFTSSRHPEVLQTLTSFHMLQRSCLMTSRGHPQTQLERTKRDASREPRPASEALLQQDQDAEGVLASPRERSVRQRTKRGWTMPGTLWCGAGNTAGNLTDLGIFQGTDLCCQEHDHCTETLESWEFKYGVRNYRINTISHCDCDYRFKRCLYNLNDTISTFVGITFFNLLEMPCFTMEGREGCQSWHWWGGCKEYGITPFAVLQKQGIYNYTHPFTDALDEIYKLNYTRESGRISPSSKVALPSGHPKDRAFQPGTKQRKKQRRLKHQGRAEQANRASSAGVPSAVPLHGLVSSISMAGSNAIEMKDLKVTGHGFVPPPPVQEGPVHAAMEDGVNARPVSEALEGSVHRVEDLTPSSGVNFPLPELNVAPHPTALNGSIYTVMEAPPSERDISSVAVMTDMSLHEGKEELKSDAFPNYVEDATPEPSNSEKHYSVSHLIQININPAIDHTGMGQSTTGQPCTDQSTVTQCDKGQPSSSKPNKDSTSMMRPTTGQPTTGQLHTAKSILALFSTEQPSTDQTSTGNSIRAQTMTWNRRTDQLTQMVHPVRDLPGPSQPSTDQTSIAQAMEQPRQSTSRMNYEQVYNDRVTPPRVIQYSSVQPMAKTDQRLQESTPVAEDISSPSSEDNRLGMHAVQGQIVNHARQNYGDTSIMPPSSPATTTLGKQMSSLPTAEEGLHIGSVEAGVSSMIPQEFPGSDRTSVSLSEKNGHLQGVSTGTPPRITAQEPNTNKYHPDKAKAKQHYMSKSCGCYRRLDQCEYKIAPNEERFLLHNLDVKTLYHCNCTRRLARFLQRKKRPNEVQEVLSDFVSPSCFVLEPRVVCNDGTRCKTIFAAVLAGSGHLKRTFRLLQKSSNRWGMQHPTHKAWAEESARLDKAGASLKVKRQELMEAGVTPEPVKLYEQCLQRVRNPWRHQEHLQT